MTVSLGSSSGVWSSLSGNADDSTIPPRGQVLGGVHKKLLMDGHLKSHREIHQIARTRAGQQLQCVINVPGFFDFQLQSAPIYLAWASLVAQ